MIHAPNLAFKCFNCNEYGHISHDCNKPKGPLKCSNCHMKGRNWGKCSLVTDLAPQGLRVQTKGKVSQHNFYVKTVSINRNEFQGLIDTGCLVSDSFQLSISVWYELKAADPTVVCSGRYEYTRCSCHPLERWLLIFVLAKYTPRIIRFILCWIKLSQLCINWLRLVGSSNSKLL